MPEEEQESDKPAGKVTNVAVNIHATSTMSARVRLIQQSPTANPELVEAARKFAQKLREKEGDDGEHIDRVPDAPLIVAAK